MSSEKYFELEVFGEKCLEQRSLLKVSMSLWYLWFKKSLDETRLTFLAINVKNRINIVPWMNKLERCSKHKSPIFVYLIGVARYTDVTVRYVPRFGGHGSIRFWYNGGKILIYYARFLFIYFVQTLVQITIFSTRCKHPKYFYCLLYIYIYILVVGRYRR